MTNSAPNSAVMRSTAASIGSCSGVSPPPMLMLMTLAPCSAAHCMPASIHDSSQP
jgi:hypothetical protein